MPLQISNLADRAAEQAARFELTLASQASIVGWADEAIAELPQPPIELIDLSLSGRNDADVLALLEQLATDANPTSLRPALSEFRRQVSAGAIPLRDALSRLEGFARRHANAVGTEMHNFLAWADDEYELIERGYINRTHEQLRAALDEQLRRSAAEPYPAAAIDPRRSGQ
ncbi:hypothetical protein NA78x_002191 [Anatilimnocola sp. NA78]|uniref:hypothetical protein n=1 Tax=Anatilimnocola sp. NA78 TaxID=3415683 RepID=UPI003CE4FE39